MSKRQRRSFSIHQLRQNVTHIYHEFPTQFWIVVGVSFIDRLGGAMLFPFFTLYLTRKFNIGMTEVGVMFALYSIASVVGSMIGGALTDRIGRKAMVLFGLVMSATSALLMGFINQIELFYLVILLVGALGEAAGPAHQALIADLLPEEKRAEGFGILRVVFNLSVTIGPLLGGLIASQSFLLLFIADAVTSLITAVLVYFTLQETWHPQADESQPAESMGSTFAGYLNVLRDFTFLWYMGASMLMVLVYIQMNTTLAVYLRDQHGVSVVGFSYILSLNAAMVVLFQFPITRWVSRYRPLMVIVVGALFYSLGFAMYGFVNQYWLFLAAMVIITIGEMIVSPVSQAIVARLAPEDMRGRYMAVFGFTWVIPSAVGPLLAGLVIDNGNPDWVWYGAGLIGVLSATGFFLLEKRVDRTHWDVVDQRLKILERLELGKISAEEAGLALDQVSAGGWGRLAPETSTASQSQVRFQVRDSDSGATKVDLRLPLGLVNIVLHMGGQYSADLSQYDPRRLNELISRSKDQNSSQHLESDGEHLEISME